MTRVLEPIVHQLPEIDFYLWDLGDSEPIPQEVYDRCKIYIPGYMSPSASIEVISKMSCLEVVQILSAGVDSFLPHLPPGITLCNAKGVHDSATAELTLALILAALRGIPKFVKDGQNHIWDSVSARSLADSKALIVGYGSVGEAIERRLIPCEVEVVRVARNARQDVHPISEVHALLPEADIVIVVVPLTSETKAMVDENFLNKMKPGALLVNVARGPVVDTQALIEALQCGQISAALDVTDPEPLPQDSPLWDLENCLISPHVGGKTNAFLPRIERLVAQNIGNLYRGEKLLNVISGEY